MPDVPRAPRRSVSNAERPRAREPARRAPARRPVRGVRTRAIHPGDLVLVDRRGRLFYAKVAGLEQAGVLAIEPLERRVTYRTAKAREVVDHWAHSRADRDERPPSAQLRLEVLP